MTKNLEVILDDSEQPDLDSLESQVNNQTAILFIDSGTMEYNVNTPYSEPLGGTHAACCYQMKLLAKKNKVILANQWNKENQIKKIDNVLHVIMPKTVNDLVIIINTFMIKKIIEINSAFILHKLAQFEKETNNILVNNKIAYIQHDSNQQAVSLLSEQKNYVDKFWLVSDYQKNNFVKDFGISEDKIIIHRNAISPFCEIPIDNKLILESLLDNKKMQLIYISTPWRGLEKLLDIFPILKKHFPNLELLVFSSLKTYQQSDDTTYQPLYDRCKSTEGVSYKGSINQKDLAKYLKSSLIMLYPNCFPETSCISVMEAMATGNFVITSSLGALPETCDDYGILCDSTEDYIQATIRILNMWLYEKNILKTYLLKQIQNFQSKNIWSERLFSGIYS